MAWRFHEVFACAHDLCAQNWLLQSAKICDPLKFIIDIHYNIIEPVHEISNNVVCATSKASDQPAHARRLIIAFASRLSVLRLLSF